MKDLQIIFSFLSASRRSDCCDSCCLIDCLLRDPVRHLPQGGRVQEEGHGEVGDEWCHMQHILIFNASFNTNVFNLKTAKKSFLTKQDFITCLTLLY